MTCSNEYLSYRNNDQQTVSSVFPTECVSITSNVVSFIDGSETSWVFADTAPNIKEIDFSGASGLVSIGSYTFYQCTKVTTFDLSHCIKLSSIGICAFRECTSATNIILPSFSPLTVIPGGCFSYCSSLPVFTIPDTIVTIDGDNPANHGAFYSCSSLKTVYFLPNSRCESIGSKTFYYAGIVNITLPSTLKSITGMSFRQCSSLEAIYVNESNKNFYSYNGLLLTTANSLVYFPSKSPLITANKLTLPSVIKSLGKICFAGLILNTLELHDGIETLSESSFGYNSIQNIIISKSVKQFPRSAFGFGYGLKNITFLNQPDYFSSMCFERCSSLYSFNIPPTVTSLGDGCFEMCSNLQTVYVPKSVVSFGSGVFVGCHVSLQLIFDNDSSLVFDNFYLYNNDMTNLKLYLGTDDEAVIQNYVQVIDAAAFQGRTIKTVTFNNPENITSIGSYAFSKCSQLTKIILPETISIISSYLFNEATSLSSITIPSNVNSIQDSAFKECSQLKEIIFSSQTNLKTISKESFYNCQKLSQITLPNSVLSIGDDAFFNCSLKENFDLPVSLQTIGEYSFSNTKIKQFKISEFSLQTLTSLSFASMPSLISFSIPDSVETLESTVFYQCNMLSSVSFGSGLTSIAESSFKDLPELQSISIGTNTNLKNMSSLSFDDCPKLKNFILSGNNNFNFKDGILFNKEKTEIILFLKANKPKTIPIPSTVESISQYAFSSCNTIESVDFEENSVISDIKLGAFQNCNRLKSVNFPPSLKSLGTSSFENCNLEIIYLLQTNITELLPNTFSGNKHVKQIILPIVLSSSSESSFSNIYQYVNVFYHGKNIIENKVGLSRKAHVFCYQDYKSDKFFGLPVSIDLNQIITCDSNKMIHINNKLTLIYLLVMK